MKKIISILFASLMLASLVACSAADNSTITSPRMGKTTINCDVDDCDD